MMVDVCRLLETRWRGQDFMMLGMEESGFKYWYSGD